jgi:hypothetical protein
LSGHFGQQAFVSGKSGIAVYQFEALVGVGWLAGRWLYADRKGRAVVNVERG